MSTIAPPRRSRPTPPTAPRHAYATRGAAAVAVAEPTPVPPRAPRPKAAPRPNHLRVVAPAERTRRSLTPAMAVLLTAMLFAILFAVAIAHTVLVQGQVRLDRLDAELTEEQARYQQLRKDVAELESPPRIVAAAQEAGMVTPDDLIYLQPRAADPATVGATSGDHRERTADPTVAADAERAWSTMKALLEAPTP